MRRRKSIITEKNITKYQKICNELNRDTETQSQDDSIEKGNIKKILNKRKNMKKRNIKKTLNEQENVKKKATIPNEKENMKETKMRKTQNQKENTK